jgi:hypothetical protein
VGGKKAVIIIPGHNGCAVDFIIIGESTREVHNFLWIPFEFECADLAINLLQIIDFLFARRPRFPIRVLRIPLSKK